MSGRPFLLLTSCQKRRYSGVLAQRESNRFLTGRSGFEPLAPYPTCAPPTLCAPPIGAAEGALRPPHGTAPSTRLEAAKILENLGTRGGVAPASVTHLRRSSSEERLAVNQDVAGSTPVDAANGDSPVGGAPRL